MFLRLQIENGHKSQTEFLHDFCAGKVFSSHPLFSAHVDALQIFFYFDELEVCNPLGSKAKIHNLGKWHTLNTFYIERLLFLCIHTRDLLLHARQPLSKVSLKALSDSTDRHCRSSSYDLIWHGRCVEAICG